MYHNDSMQVIRHYHVAIHCDAREYTWQFAPPSFDHLPGIVQDHLSGLDFAEKRLAQLRHHRNEIGTSLRIIISLQAD